MTSCSEYMYFPSKHNMTNEEVKFSRFFCLSSKLYFDFKTLLNRNFITVIVCTKEGKPIGPISAVWC